MAFALKRRRRKALPGTTTLAANDKNPTKESNSSLLIDDFCKACLTRSLAFCSLSGGSRASMSTVSNSMPKKSIT